MSIYHYFRGYSVSDPCIASIVSASMLFAAPMQAREALIISLDSVEDRISKQNPDLAAARKLIEEATGRLTQSGQLSNPVLGLELSHDPDFLEHSFSVSISQKFPVTNRLALARSISETSLRAAEAEVLDAERLLLSRGKQLVIRMLAIRKQQHLLQQQKSLADEFASHLSELTRKGEGSVLDAGQARIEAAQFTNQLQQLAARSSIIEGELKPLLGMTVAEPLSVTGELTDFKLPKRSYRTNRRPDLISARLKASAAETSAELERAKSRDDIELILSAGANRTEDAPLGYDTEQHFGIGVRIPLPFWDRNEGAIEEADARSSRRRLEVSALEHHIQHEAAASYGQMSQWADIGEEITTKLLPMAHEQAKLALSAYHEGQGDIQTTLRAREQVLKLASARLEALRDFHLAKARYESALNQ